MVFGLWQVGSEGRQGGSPGPSAKLTEHVPTSMEAASSSLIMFLTMFSPVRGSHGSEDGRESGRRGRRAPGVRCSESGTRMRFRSAKEDLEETTLRALTGQIGRLDYLAGLRQDPGGYEHWGLTKVYGEAGAQAALGAAHAESANAILRRTLPELAAEAGERAGEIFERPAAEALPEGSDALGAAHFSLVWNALRSVARRRASRRPAA